MSHRFAVVHEAVSDFETATELADRVLCESIGWLDDDLLIHQRTWLGESCDGQRLTWARTKHLALGIGIAAVGHFNGEPAKPDAVAARRAVLYLQREFPDLEAIVLIRDQDDQPDRFGGLEQARKDGWGGVVVVGFAVVERECWVLSGFLPSNEAETERLEIERKRLGFNPTTRSHELTACKQDQATRSPKRVLRALCGDDRERERRCWQETPLAILRERGSENGLASFLAEVRERLAVLIGHTS